MSTLKTTNLQNASAASPAIVLDANSRATLNGLSYPTDGSLSGRNRIINGDMRIDQRNAGASVTPTTTANGFPVDRFFVAVSQNSKLTTQQNAGSVTPPAGFKYYLGITSSSAYSIISSDYFTVQQNIEGYNVADLEWGTANAKTVTLSFWVRSSLTGTFGGALRNSGLNRSYPFTYSISAANTWEQKTITILGDTSGTWNTTDGIGMSVIFSLGLGSISSGTAGAWAAANYASATGATSVVGTNGATFYITGVQLEAGSVATPFERRSYGQELALCQRYAQFAAFGTYGRAQTTTAVVLFATYSTMRAIPTSSLAAGSITCDNGIASTTAASPSIIAGTYNLTGSRIFIGGFSGLTAGDTWPLSTPNCILFLAEL